MAIIQLRNAEGALRRTPTGFSWTTLLFYAFVPLLRGDLKWTLVFLLTALITFNLSQIIFPFFYNKIYIKELLHRGFVPFSERDKEVLIQMGLWEDQSTDAA